VTIPLVIGAFFLSEVVTPAAEIKSSEASLYLLGKSDGSRLNSGYWFKEAAPDKGTRIINISQLKSNGNVGDVTLYEFNRNQELLAMSQAKEGHFTKGTLVLSEVTQTRIDALAVSALSDPHQPQPPLTHIQSLPTRVLQTSLTPDRLIARILTPERMSLLDLSDYIDYLESNQLQTERQV